MSRPPSCRYMRSATAVTDVHASSMVTSSPARTMVARSSSVRPRRALRSSRRISCAALTSAALSRAVNQPLANLCPWSGGSSMRRESNVGSFSASPLERSETREITSICSAVTRPSLSAVANWGFCFRRSARRVALYDWNRERRDVSAAARARRRSAASSIRVASVCASIASSRIRTSSTTSTRSAGCTAASFSARSSRMCRIRGGS